MARGPYYKLKDAARYCGYSCPSHFGQLLQSYCVPAKGPRANRYSQSDLDAFMENPRAFLAPTTPPKPRPGQQRLHL